MWSQNMLQWNISLQEFGIFLDNDDDIHKNMSVCFMILVKITDKIKLEDFPTNVLITLHCLLSPKPGKGI